MCGLVNGRQRVEVGLGWMHRELRAVCRHAIRGSRSGCDRLPSQLGILSMASCVEGPPRLNLDGFVARVGDVRDHATGWVRPLRSDRPDHSTPAFHLGDHRVHVVPERLTVALGHYLRHPRII